MDELHNSGKIDGVNPDAGCLNVALACMAKQTRQMSPRRIESLLKKYDLIANVVSWGIGMFQLKSEKGQCRGSASHTFAQSSISAPLWETPEKQRA